MKSLTSILAVTFAALGLSLAVPAPRALACGGYQRSEPAEHSYIRAAMQQHAERRADIGRYWLQGIELDGDRATVLLRYDHARHSIRLEQSFTLAYAGDSWRIVARERAVRVV